MSSPTRFQLSSALMARLRALSFPSQWPPAWSRPSTPLTVRAVRSAPLTIAASAAWAAGVSDGRAMFRRRQDLMVTTEMVPQSEGEE